MILQPVIKTLLKKKCHISLSQANNKRWVPAAASQLPNGRALLSTHLLQLWVRTLLHGSLAGGRGFVMRGSQCVSHAQRPHTALRMFGLRHPEIVYMLAVFWLGQFFPIRCSHASSVASHFFFFNVCRNYIVVVFLIYLISYNSEKVNTKCTCWLFVIVLSYHLNCRNILKENTTELRQHHFNTVRVKCEYLYFST